MICQWSAHSDVVVVGYHLYLDIIRDGNCRDAKNAKLVSSHQLLLPSPPERDPCLFLNRQAIGTFTPWGVPKARATQTAAAPVRLSGLC